MVLGKLHIAAVDSFRLAHFVESREKYHRFREFGKGQRRLHELFLLFAVAVVPLCIPDVIDPFVLDAVGETVQPRRIHDGGTRALIARIFRKVPDDADLRRPF